MKTAAPRLAVLKPLIILVAAGLAASCASADYLDRREGVSAEGGEAQATNLATQTVNPLPPASADRSLVFNGQKMQSAVDRYRTGKTQPVEAAKDK